MDRLLEQKRKGQQNFRTKITQFIQSTLLALSLDSPYAKKTNQLTTPTLQELLQMPLFDGICNNGRINVQKLCEKVATTETNCSPKELAKVLGNRKEMKIGELQQLLKSYQLHEFDLEEQIVRLLFENGGLSLKKLENLMGQLGMGVMNCKDREILVECFDLDRDEVITRGDLEGLLTGGSQDQLRSTQMRM